MSRRPGRTWRKVAARGAGLAVGLLLVPGLAAASLLVVAGETRAGRTSGGASAAVLVGLVAGFGAWRAPGRGWGWLAALPAVAAAALVMALVRGAAADRPEGDFGLQSRFGAGSGVPRYSPARLVPERDQVGLMVNLATRPIFWSARARTIREATIGLYRSIEADPAARGLGAVTHLGLLEAVGGDFRRSAHAFAYVPEPRTGERLGLVVFLHGNGGNFQVLPWAWREFAEGQRFVILCPTFGLGFWGEGGVEAVDRALDDALARWPMIDRSKVYLGGISDGGVGVTRSALAHPGRYRGLIYVSPTMKLGELADPRFLEGWRGRPILIVQGGRDWNVPKDTVDPAVDLLRAQGSAVTYEVFPDEDHFLFFARSTELFGRVVEWMGKSGGRPAPPRTEGTGDHP